MVSSPRIFPGAQPPKSLTEGEIADLFSDLGKLKRRSDTADLIVTALRRKIALQVTLLVEAKAMLEDEASAPEDVDEEDRARLIGALSEVIGAKDEIVVEVDPLPGLPKGSLD